jgi:L-arabinose isomerase
MSPTKRPKIGLLGLTLELYETLAPDLRASREAWVRRVILPALQPYADVLFDAAVYRRESIEAAIQHYEAADADALLVVLLTYSPSQIALPALRRTRLPLLIWNAMIDNHGVHGTEDLANVLVRAGVRFHYVTSHPKEKLGLTELGDFFAAAAAVRRLRSALVGLIGYPFPGMGDFAIDTTHLVSTLGCSWTHLSVEDYVQRSAAASVAAVDELVAEYRRAYDPAPDLTDADLENTARAELALRGLVSDHRLDALTYQFMAFGEDERSATLPFVATSRLMADGLGFAGEGDLVGALATALFQWLKPPASFTEIFTIDFSGNSVFMSHMGEANAVMARRDRRIPLVARPTPITRTRHRQLTLVIGA